MKVIIEIDERAYKACLELKTDDDMGFLGAHLINATAKGICLTSDVHIYIKNDLKFYEEDK